MRCLAKACVLAAATALMGAGGAAAQIPEARALVLTAENLMADNPSHREHAKRGGNPAAVFPGDMLRYRLVFTNVKDMPVKDVEFTDPLPPGLHYVAESATASSDDTVIEYSIDGGTSYSTRPMIAVTVNGRRVMRPAPPERYTHLRWRIRGWVQPGAQVVAEFRAVLAESNGN